MFPLKEIMHKILLGPNQGQEAGPTSWKSRSRAWLVLQKIGSSNLLTMMQNVEIHGRLCNESLGAKPDLTCTIIVAKPNLRLQSFYLSCMEHT